MLFDSITNQMFGTITKYIQPEASIAAVLDFVEKHLPEFAQKYNGVKNEKGLTNKLISLLSLYSQNSLFRFIKDDPENPYDGNSPTIDIGVYANEGIHILTRHYNNDESFFSFEAKILSCKVNKNRRREYLVGHADAKKGYIDCGGIERFKKGIHGRNLSSAGMIAYIQDQDYSFWHSTINGWIDELALNSRGEIKWNTDDKLIKETSIITSRFVSNNSRVGMENITLYHLWIEMNTIRQAL